jgi:NitT/TauT family transport system permease protein
MTQVALMGRLPIRRQRSIGAARQFLPHVVGAVTALACWYLLTRSLGMLRAFGPAETFSALPRLLAHGRFWVSLFQSLERLLGGLALAAVIGIPVGIAVGYLRWFAGASYVPFQVIRMVSPLSWAPVAIILFGVGSAPVYFLITIAALWPIVLNTAAGVRSAEPQWIDAAKCLGAGRLDILRFVILRAALPNILTGIQLALGVGWIVLVPAEMLGVASGLGYLILDFRDVNDYASIMSLIVVIGGLGLLIDWPTRVAVRWASMYRGSHE